MLYYLQTMCSYLTVLKYTFSGLWIRCLFPDIAAGIVQHVRSLYNETSGYNYSTVTRSEAIKNNCNVSYLYFTKSADE